MTHSGGKPHAVGDRGQRFVVSFLPEEGSLKGRMDFGYTNSADSAVKMVNSINAHPVWHTPRVSDREKGCTVPGDEFVKANGRAS